MSAKLNASTARDFEVGVVYARKERPYRVDKEPGLQAWKYLEGGVWQAVFCLETDHGLMWLTEDERETILSMSERGEVYTGRRSMRRVEPKDGAQGWIQAGDYWKQRKEVSFLNGEWQLRQVVEMTKRMAVVTPRL